MAFAGRQKKLEQVAVFESVKARKYRSMLTIL